MLLNRLNLIVILAMALFSNNRIIPAMNITHNPVLPEGGTMPIREIDALSGIVVQEDGRIVMPTTGRAPVSQPLRMSSNRHTSLTPPAICGTYTLQSGQYIRIASPYFPRNYWSNFMCLWRLYAAQDGELSLKCHYFSLGPGDFLYVKHNSNSGVRYYNTDNPYISSTEGSRLTLFFYSNGSLTDRGFNCEVSYLAPSLNFSHPLCGQVPARIVNGEVTEPHEYPWQVWLQITWNDGARRYCGGSIIHNQWVVTAAHCTYRRNNDSSLWYPTVRVAMGGHALNNPGLHGGEWVTVTRIIMHPNLRIQYDIALLKLSASYNFTNKVAPVCLPPRTLASEDFAGITVTLSGMGRTETGYLSSELRDYSTVGYSFESCRNFYGRWLSETLMCTDGSENKHTCFGDSGGPVTTVGRHQRIMQVGVISFVSSRTCSHQNPDGHVRLAAFIAWIEQVTGLTFPE